MSKIVVKQQALFLFDASILITNNERQKKKERQEIVAYSEYESHRQDNAGHQMAVSQPCRASRIKFPRRASQDLNPAHAHLGIWVKT